MRRIVVETETANKFIEDIEALAAKNDLNIELNMDELGGICLICIAAKIRDC